MIKQGRFFFQFLLFIVSCLFFQNVENAPTEVFKTAYKGVGLRATADFPKETFIMEYVGEVLNESKFHKRAKKYSKVSLHSFSKMIHIARLWRLEGQKIGPVFGSNAVGIICSLWLK